MKNAKWYEYNFKTISGHIVAQIVQRGRITQAEMQRKINQLSEEHQQRIIVTSKLV